MRQLADQSGSIVNGSFGKSNITRCQRLSPQSGRFKRKIQNSIEVRSTGKASEINEQSHGTVDSSSRCWRGEVPYSPPTNTNPPGGARRCNAWLHPDLGRHKLR